MSAYLEVAIVIVTVFLLASLIVLAVTELISSLLKLRAGVALESFSRSSVQRRSELDGRRASVQRLLPG